jgi:hypothetical protein
LQDVAVGDPVGRVGIGQVAGRVGIERARLLLLGQPVLRPRERSGCFGPPRVQVGDPTLHGRFELGARVLAQEASDRGIAVQAGGEVGHDDADIDVEVAVGDVRLPDGGELPDVRARQFPGLDAVPARGLVRAPGRTHGGRGQ